MRYRYRRWCDTCLDDPYGCFDGDMETSEETFESIEAAEDAALDATECASWCYDLIDEQGNVVQR